MQHFRLLVLMMAVVLTGCSQMTTTSSSTPPPSLASLASAHAYLATVLDDMQQYSINRQKIDRTKVRQQTFARADGATTPAETYPAIQYALTALGDHHSFFLDPSTAQQMQTGGLTADEQPLSQQIPGGIGYLKLPHFEGSQQAAIHYAQSAQDLIQGIDQAGNTCGWVVDLRDNTGGNMWPMLAGVGPILGEGTVGWFVGPTVKQAWSYTDGQAQLEGSAMLKIERAYQLKHPNPPVSILTDSMTASSGEAIVVAFRGRPEMRSFGQATDGVPTANQTFTLRDGALLVITVALDADRTRQTYDGPIQPDQYVPSDPSHFGTPADPTIQAATTWLQTQKACRG